MQPIVCDLTAIPANVREQHVLNAPRIFQAAQEIQALPNGYAFRLPNEPGMWMALATFVENERHCCPFWAFGLTVEPNGGPLWLQLTGVEGTKQLLETALSEQRDEVLFQRLFNTGGDQPLEQAVAQSMDALSGVLTRWQVEAMLEGFTIEQFNEEESDGKTALGDTKHWHTFAVVAVKR